MTFSIIAMICVAGMSHSDCAPVPGFSRAHKIVLAGVENEMVCAIQSQRLLAGDAVFTDLDPGEFIKIMCVRK